MAILRKATFTAPLDGGSATTQQSSAFDIDSGDVIVVFAKWEDVANAASSVTDTAGNSYTWATVALSNGAHLRAAYAVVTAGQIGNVVTVNYSSAAPWREMVGAVYSGVDGTTPLDDTATSTGFGTSIASASLDPTDGGAVVFATGVFNLLDFSAWNNSLVEQVDGDTMAFADAVGVSAGAITPAVTASSESGGWVAISLAFKSATGGVPSGRADLTGSGVLTATARAITFGVATLTGSGVLDASTDIKVGAAVLGGTGTLAATANAIKFGAATLTGSGNAIVTFGLDQTIVPEANRTAWELAGMLTVNGIPDRTTVYTTLTTLGPGNNNLIQIQNAINACPVGQVVLLNPGDFEISGYILLNKGITLRGSGPGVTRIVMQNGAVMDQEAPGPTPEPCIIVGPARYGVGGTSYNLSADVAKGSYSLTLSSVAGLAVGDIVLLDERSGASWQTSPMGLGDVLASADGRVIWNRHNPSQPTDDPVFYNSATGQIGDGSDAASWFCRQDRPTSEWKEIASIVGNTVTFTSPTHISYRTANSAQIYKDSYTFVKNAGVEDLTVIYGDNGNIRFNWAAYCWAKNVENTEWHDEGFAIDSSFRIEIQRCYIHDAVWAQPGGAGYAISLSQGSSEVLIEDSISVRANKVMVSRCSGAGSVVGYVYADQGYINTNGAWIEIGLNASHMVGPHHVLFEGCYGHNFDSDKTHGNSVYLTVFRNALRGIRRAFINPHTGLAIDDDNQPGNGPRRCAGAAGYSRYMAFIGNVLGADGEMTGWAEEGSFSPGQSGIWLLGWNDWNPYTSDPNVATSTFRHGNYDYVTNSQKWEVSEPNHALPASLYRTSAPAFFDGYTWPWVEPGASTPTTRVLSLPAQDRFLAIESGTNLASLTGAGALTVTAFAIKPATAILTGSGNISPTAFAIKSASATLAGTGTLTARAAPREISVFNRATEVPPNITTGNTDPITVGHEFYATISGWVTQAHFYKATSAGDTFRARIYSRAGAILADTGSQTVSSGEGWRSLAFPTPFEYTPGTNYVVAVFYPAGNEPCDQDGAFVAVFNGGSFSDPTGTVVFPQDGSTVNGVTAVNGRNIENVAMSFPNTSWRGASSPLGSGSYNYFVDLTFTDESPLPLQTGTATLTGSGSTNVFGQVIKLASATLTGVGTLLAYEATVANAVLTGAGALTASGLTVVHGSAALTGAGTLTAVPASTGINLAIIPADRRTTWNPGLIDQVSSARTVYNNNGSGLTTLTLTLDGTGDNSTAINNAISAASSAYIASGATHLSRTLQEVVLPAGTIRFVSPIIMRTGVVLRGQDSTPAGPFRNSTTRLRYDGTGTSIRYRLVGFSSFPAGVGPYSLVSDAAKGSNEIVLTNANATNISVGDILCIDEEDDTSFVALGDAYYEKRQTGGDQHGPALRGAGLWRSVTTMVEVTGKTVGASNTTITLRDPLHMNFRTSFFAQVYHLATLDDGRTGLNQLGAIRSAGVENLYVTGGPIMCGVSSYSWLKNVEVDGWPGTTNIGSYTNPAGISGRSVNIFQAYRFQMEGCYVHHTTNIVQGGGGYLVSLSTNSSECLLWDNIVIFGNKTLVGNMMGGGNVIAYNYVDNAKTNSANWQEGTIDLNHQCFTHNCLVEGNVTTNIGSDTTHGNAGWHVFLRNYASSKNTNPLWGNYPYSSGSDTQNMRAAGVDGFHRETTFIGNVLDSQTGASQGAFLESNDLDGTTEFQRNNRNYVWRLSYFWGGPPATPEGRDNGEARTLIYRDYNWDRITNGVTRAVGATENLPASFFLTSPPPFFAGYTWPNVNPDGSTDATRVLALPAEDRYYVGPSDASATLSGAGALTATAVKIAFGAAVLSGTGVLDSTAAGIQLGASTLTGSGSVAATGRAIAFGQGALGGAGSAVATAGSFATAQTTMTGTGALSAAGVVLARAQALLAGAGVLTASARAEVRAQAALSGSGQLLISGDGLSLGSCALTGSSALSATAVRMATAQATLVGLGGDVSASALLLRVASVVLTGAGSVTADGWKTTFASANLQGGGALVASLSAIIAGAANMAGTGGLLAVGTDPSGRQTPKGRKVGKLLTTVRMVAVRPPPARRPKK